MEKYVYGGLMKKIINFIKYLFRKKLKHAPIIRSLPLLYIEEPHVFHPSKSAERMLSGDDECWFTED